MGVRSKAASLVGPFRLLSMSLYLFTYLFVSYFACLFVARLELRWFGLHALRLRPGGTLEGPLSR